MKHIKNFFKNNEIITKFKEGDLIVPIISLEDKVKKYVETKYGKISHIYNSGICEIIYDKVPDIIIKLMYDSNVGFHKEYNPSNGKYNVKVWLHEDMIRHLTTDELERYKIKKDTDKYNL